MSGVDDKKTIKVVDYPGLIVFVLLLLVVFWQFFTRYALSDSAGWTEEISRFLLILSTFLGSITVVRKGTNISVEFFHRYLSKEMHRWISILIESVNFIFYSYLVWLGIRLSLYTKQDMVTLPIPKSIIYWLVSIALGGMSIYSLYRIINKLKQHKL